MNELDLTKVHTLGWIDNDTYSFSVEAEPEKDKKGNDINCFYEIEYHKDEDKVIFYKAKEDDHGGFDSVDISDQLSKEAKESVLKYLRETLGEEFRL